MTNAPRTAPVVYHRPDRYGRGPWRVIITTGCIARHVAIPDTDEGTPRDDQRRPGPRGDVGVGPTLGGPGVGPNHAPEHGGGR